MSLTETQLSPFSFPQVSSGFWSLKNCHHNGPSVWWQLVVLSRFPSSGHVQPEALPRMQASQNHCGSPPADPLHLLKLFQRSLHQSPLGCIPYLKQCQSQQGRFLEGGGMLREGGEADWQFAFCSILRVTHSSIIEVFRAPAMCIMGTQSCPRGG